MMTTNTKIRTTALCAILAFAALYGMPSVTAAECDEGHWIQKVSAGGKVIELEDGSTWQVSPVDTITSMLWLPVTEITVCGNTLINTDDGEKVEATRMTKAPASDRKPAPSRQQGYTIEAAVDDEVFIINGETYEAQTYCFGFEEGDRVKFLKGSPFGACATAEILHLRSGKTCKLWCE